MSWLKDRWEELNAQVKMGDNRTASTVRAARKPAAPAQTMRANTNQPGWSVRKPQPAPLTTQQRISQSYGPTGFTGLKNYAKDMLFDNNSEADRIKRYAATGLNESYDQEQARKTKEAQASNDKLGTIHQVMKSVPAGTAGFLAKTPGAIGQMQGRTAKTVNEIDNPLLRTGAKLVSAPLGGMMTTKQANTNIKTGRGLNERIDNKMQQSAFGDRADDNKYVTGAGKMFGQLGGQIATGGLGTYITGAQMAADEANKAEAKGKSNDYALGVGAIQGTLGGLSEKYGVDKFIPGKGNVTGNLVTKMGKRFLTEGTQEAQQQFTQNLIANKLYDPNQGLKDGVVQSGLMGGFAGGVMSPAVDIMNRPTAPKPTTSLVAPKPEPTRTRLRPEEARIWSDYQETLYKGNKMPAQVVNETHNKARQIADSLGVDIITGSPDDIAARMNPLLEQSMAFQKEPTTGLVSRARNVVKPLNSVGGGILPTPLDNMADKLNNRPSGVEKMTEEQYLARNGAGFMEGSEPALQQNRISTKRGQSNAVNTVMDNMSQNNKRRAELRAEYQQKVANGEIQQPNRVDTLIERANGLPELQSTQAAQRLLKKQGIDWKKPKSDPLESLKQEAKRFGYDKGYTEEGQIANTIDELMKEQNAVREVGIPLYDKYKSKLDGTKTITEMMTPTELKAYRAAEAKSEKASKLLNDYFDYKKGNNQATQSQPPKAKPSPLESLKQEARKYKSAEEFKYTLGKLYRGGEPLDVSKIGSSGLPMTTSEKVAQYYRGGKKNGVIEQYFIDPNARIKPVDGKNTKTESDRFTALAKAEKEGYDGINLVGGAESEFRMSNNSKLLTEKQLTDLYNQATQSQPPKSTQAKPPTPFEQNLQTAGLKPIQKNVLTAKLPAQTQDQLATSPNQGSSKQQTQKTESGSSKLSPIPQVSEKTNASVSLQPSVQRTNESSKGLILAEREAPNGQRIQKVRTGKGVVEQRTVADQIGDALGMTQDQREPSFNAVAAAKNSSSAKRLVEALNMNDDITQAAAQAQQDGKEINFFAKKDANGRSVGVERFDPQYHKIDAGFVTDRNGNVLGNHIKVDSTGVQVNVGGDVVNMDRVLGNPIDWGNKYEASSTMERNIYQNAPTKEIADKTYKFTVGHKIQSEANYKTELQQQRKALADRTKATLAAKPRRIKSEEYKADLFDFIENTSTYTDMVGKYGETTAKVMSDYKTSTRTLYNDLLKRVNEQFGKFGMEQVPQRKDYLTHINELMDKKSYVGELVGQLQNSIADEGKDRTRGAIPTDIAGRSENFKPTKKWNRFFQERRGGEFTKDPFKAVDAYLEPTLHNIHMTESGVRTRAVEATFRTVSQLKNMDTSYVQKELGDSLVKFKVQGGNDKLVRGFQEYANAITGKTEALDRQIIDKSDASATALRGWQKLQSVGGRATILGNLNSVLMQPLNQIATMAQTNPANYLKGIAATISGDKTYQQSPFLKARNAKVDSYFRSKGQKFLDKGAVPLELVEKAAIRNTWNAQYQSVLKDGYKGKEAITETDRRTERTVAGRGIADRPELYRSTLANGVLQYTLEMNAQNKMFWRDLTPVQKAEFMVASSGVNMILGAVTGNTPMPDFIKAMFDSVMDFADGEDDDSVLENAGQAVQRVGGEAASMNPLVSAGANLLPKSARQVAFGKESDLGRYDGTSAPVQVVKNVVDTGSKLAQGKYTDARNSALKTVPFGNQIQKTWRGAEAISEGKTEGSPWQAAKAIAFGPNAINTDTAKETRFSATPSKSKGTVNASSVDEILKSQFSTKEQKAWLKLSAADRKAEAEQDPEKAKWLKQYEATKRVNKNAPERPEGLSKESETILNWHNKRTPQQREKLAYTQNDYDYKLATAQFEEAKLNGTVSRAEMINKQQALAKAKVGKDFTKDTRESYNSLSKAELTTLAENDPNGKQIMADAIAYGDALVKAGLIKKNKLRTGSGSGGRRGGRGGKGKASKFDYTKNLFDSGSDSASTSKQLRAILEKAMSGKS